MCNIVNFSELDPELLWSILRRTDPQDLSFRLVCQAWNRATRCCLEEVNMVLVGNATFPLWTRFSLVPLNWESKSCCKQLKLINCQIQNITKSKSKLLCSSQLERLEQEAAKEVRWRNIALPPNGGT